MTIPRDKMAKVYGIKSKTIYPYENFEDENSHNFILDNLAIDEFKSSMTIKLSLQAEIDEFNRNNSKKTGKELTLDYMEKDVRKL